MNLTEPEYIADCDVLEKELSLTEPSLCDLALLIQDGPDNQVNYNNSENESMFNLTNLTIASSTAEQNRAVNSFKIEKIIGNRNHKVTNNCVNRKNLIKIDCNKNEDLLTCTLKTAVVNARSLFPKIVEAIDLFDNLSLDIMAISETWENSNGCTVQGGIVEQMEGLHQLGYVSQPRTNSRKLRGGGVGLIYSLCRFRSVKLVLSLPKNLELLGTILTPLKPSPLIRNHIVFVLYNPPSTPKSQLRVHLNFIDNTLSELVKKYPISHNEYVICGDFNQLKCEEIINFFPDFVSLNQIPTRKKRVLDYFLTSHSNHYNIPDIIAPLCHGLPNASDHKIVLAGPRPTKQ